MLWLPPKVLKREPHSDLARIVVFRQALANGPPISIKPGNAVRFGKGHLAPIDYKVKVLDGAHIALGARGVTEAYDTRLYYISVGHEFTHYRSSETSLAYFRATSVATRRTQIFGASLSTAAHSLICSSSR